MANLSSIPSPYLRQGSVISPLQDGNRFAPGTGNIIFANLVADPGGLGPTDEGLLWYRSDLNAWFYWDGAAAQPFSSGASSLQSAYTNGSSIVTTASTPMQVLSPGVTPYGVSPILNTILMESDGLGLSFAAVSDSAAGGGIPAVAGGELVIGDTAVTFPAADQIDFGVDLTVATGPVNYPAAVVGVTSNFVAGCIVSVKTTNLAPTDEGQYTVVGLANGITTNSIAIVVDTATQAPPTFTSATGTANCFNQVFGLQAAGSDGGPQNSFLRLTGGNGTAPVLGIINDNANMDTALAIFSGGSLRSGLVNLQNFGNFVPGNQADVPYINLAGNSGLDAADIRLNTQRFTDPSVSSAFGPSVAVSFADNNPNPDTITGPGGFIAADIRPGLPLTVSGSASNDGTYIVETVTDTVITLNDSETLVNEAAGASVTLTSLHMVGGEFWYNATAGTLNYFDGTTSLVVATGAAGGNTLDQAYDQGGAGAGRTIIADSGPVLIQVPNTANNAGFRIEQGDVTNNPSGLEIANVGTGLDVAAINWSVTQSGQISGAAGNFSGAASLQLGAASTTSGNAIFFNSANANTQAIQGSGTAASYTMILPLVAPANGQLIGINAGGQMSFEDKEVKTVGGLGDYADVATAVAAGDYNLRVISSTSESSAINLPASTVLEIEIENNVVWNLADEQILGGGNNGVRIFSKGHSGVTAAGGQMSVVGTTSQTRISLGAGNSWFEIDAVIVNDISTTSDPLVTVRDARFENMSWFLPNTSNCGVSLTGGNMTMDHVEMRGGGNSCDQVIGGTGGPCIFNDVEFTGTFDNNVIINTSGMTAFWTNCSSSITTPGLTVWTFGRAHIQGWQDFSGSGVNRFFFGNNSQVDGFYAPSSEFATNDNARISNSEFDDYNQFNTPVGTMLSNVDLTAATTIAGSGHKWATVQCQGGLTVTGNTNRLDVTCGDSTTTGGAATLTVSGTADNNIITALVDAPESITTTGTNNDITTIEF